MNFSRMKLIAAWVFAVLCGVLCAAAHLRLDNTVIDDAFITYRFSARLAMGDGLTYNDGERVLGTTTPGYALLLAGVGSVGGVNTIPMASRVLNLLFLLSAGGFAVLSARQFTREPLLLAGIFALFTLSPKTLVASYSGMESAFFMALACAAFWALLRERWRLAALLLGMLPVVRPEGVFVVGLVVLVLGIVWLREIRLTARTPRNSNEQRAMSNEANAKTDSQDAGLRATAKEGERRLARPAWGTLMVCAVLMGLPMVVWGVVATLYYGSPLPHSIVAKQAGLYPIGIIGSFLSLLGGLTETYLLLVLLPNSFSRLPIIVTGPALLFLLVLIVLIGVGGRKLARLHPLLAVLPLYVGVMLMFYATSETLIFPQYYGFFEPIAKLCWWAGLAAVIGRLVKKPQWAWGIAGVMVLAPSFVLYPYNSVAQQTIDLHELEVSTLRQPLYRSISQQLNPLLPEGTLVLTPEIGELGFYLDRAQILDSAGLVSPQTIAYLPIPDALRSRSGVIPPGLVEDYRPDLIVTLDVFIPEGMLESAWFRENYTAVIVWTYDWLPLESEAFYVFARNDFAPGRALAEMELQMEAPRYER